MDQPTQEQVDKLSVHVRQLSKMQEGDLIVVGSDEFDSAAMHWLKKEIQKMHPNKRFGIIGLPSGDSITMVSATEAKAILEHLAKGVKTTP